MIKGLTGGKYITVTGGNANTPYISPGAVGAGMVRYNANMQCMEVNDGNSWQQMHTSYAQVQLDSEAEMLLDWAKKKRAEEMQLNELCKQYPGPERARSNFETFKQLVLAEESVKESVQSSP